MGASLRDQASRATPRAGARLGHSAAILCAGDVWALEWLLRPRIAGWCSSSDGLSWLVFADGSHTHPDPHSRNRFGDDE